MKADTHASNPMLLASHRACQMAEARSPDLKFPHIPTHFQHQEQWSPVLTHHAPRTTPRILQGPVFLFKYRVYIL